MTDTDPDPRPYVLWKDTLPEGDAAKLLIWPQAHQASAILHLNDSVHSAYIFENREQAIQKGWELREQLLRGERPEAHG